MLKVGSERLARSYHAKLETISWGHRGAWLGRVSAGRCLWPPKRPKPVIAIAPQWKRAGKLAV